MSSPCHVELWLTEGENAPEAPKKGKKKGTSVEKVGKRSKPTAAVAAH